MYGFSLPFPNTLSQQMIQGTSCYTPEELNLPRPLVELLCICFSSALTALTPQTVLAL